MVVDQNGEIVSAANMGETVFLRTAHNYDRDQASLSSGYSSDLPSLAQQQFKDEADINTIVERFGLTGQLPENVAVPQSGDFVDAMDYQSAMNVIRSAQESFMQMPAHVREEFNNDPGRFVAFVNDPDNKDRAAKLGILAPAKGDPEPMLVKVIPEPTPKASNQSST